MKPKTCKTCKTKFTPIRFGQTCCSLGCAIKYSGELKIKAEKKKQQQEKKVLREKLKSLSQYEAEAKREFQKYIRKRDESLPCISCGTTQTDLWDGGHFKKAELYSGVIFDEMNCHRQCRKCNRYLGGNELNYREGLVKRYGEKYVLEIEEKALRLKRFKYTKDELVEIKNKYTQKLKQFKENENI